MAFLSIDEVKHDGHGGYLLFKPLRLSSSPIDKVPAGLVQSLREHQGSSFWQKPKSNGDYDQEKINYLRSIHPQNEPNDHEFGIDDYETDSDPDDDDVISNDSFYSCEGDEEVMLRFDDEEEIDDDIIDLNNFFCKICMEPKAGHEWFDMIKNCNHAYCGDCMVNYVASKLQENIAIIRCPDPDCKSGSLEPENCDWLLPQEVFERWGKALCEAAVPSSQKFYCPFRDCSAMLIVDHGSTDVRQAKCPYCRRFFCAWCKVPWHVMDCTEFQKLSVGERGKEDIMLRELARSKEWKRCPNCKFYVEKKDGCQFVLCRCRTEFCYRCGKATGTSHLCLCQLQVS